MPPRKQKKAAPAKGRGPGRERIIEALWEAHGFVGDFKQKLKQTDGSIVENAYPGAATILKMTPAALVLRIRRDRRVLYTEQVRAALHKTSGNISEASVIVGVARENLSRFINADDKLKEFQTDCELELCDTAKTTLRDAMKQREVGGAVPQTAVTASIFVMKTRGKWSERHELTGPEGAPLEHKIVIFELPDNHRGDANPKD